MASAQVKSCVLLAGLLADGETTVVEPLPTRDHTEIMLRRGRRQRAPAHDGRVTVRPRARGSSWVRWTSRATSPPRRSSSPRRLSSRARRCGCAASGVNPTRTGLLRVLERMGGGRGGGRARRAPAVSRWRTSSCARRRCAATEVEPDEVPLAIDELPLVALLGVFAEGTTVVHGAEELRRKESDRVTTVVDGLRGAGGADRGAPGRFRRRRQGRAATAARSTRAATTASRCWARSRASPRARASRSTGFEAAAVSYPAFADDLRGPGGPMTASIAPRHARRASSSGSTGAGGVLALVVGVVLFVLLVRGCSALVGGDGGEEASEAAAPPELPRGGRLVLPRHRVVAYYGAPQDPELGVLGETSPEEAARKRSPRRGKYAQPGTAGAAGPRADRDAGPVGTGRRRPAPAAPERRDDPPPPARRHARSRGCWCWTSSPGRPTSSRRCSALEPYLSQPDVGLALDPEWNVPEGTQPGQRDRLDGRRGGEPGLRLPGTARAPPRPPAEAADRAPVHRGDGHEPRPARSRPEVAMVLNMDGFGTAELKKGVYDRLSQPTPAAGPDALGGPYNGFKLFFRRTRADEPARRARAAPGAGRGRLRVVAGEARDAHATLPRSDPAPSSATSSAWTARDPAASLSASSRAGRRPRRLSTPPAAGVAAVVRVVAAARARRSRSARSMLSLIVSRARKALS